MPKPLTVWITKNCGKFFKMGILDHLTCLLRNLYAGQEARVKMGHWTTDCCSKLGKEYVKAVYCHPVYLTYMQSTSCKMLGWMKHKLESRLPGQWKWKLLSCIRLCNPMDYTVRGILQTRILEWVAFSFSRGSSQPRDQTQVSQIAGRFFISWATREAQEY